MLRVGFQHYCEQASLALMEALGADIGIGFPLLVTHVFPATS